MIQIMINFQNEMQNLEKCTHFEIFIFIQQWLIQTCDLLRQLYVFFYNKLQKNSFKNSFIWKNEKWLKNIHSPFIK